MQKYKNKYRGMNVYVYLSLLRGTKSTETLVRLSISVPRSSGNTISKNWKHGSLEKCFFSESGAQKIQMNLEHHVVPESNFLK